MSDLIVVRCPDADFVKEGWWYDITNGTNGIVICGPTGLSPDCEWELRPTNTFETNDSGEVAEVWHVVRV